MLSNSVQDYLKALYEMGGESEMIGTGAVAARLAVTPASVTSMLQKLAASDAPLVHYKKHRGARLTDEGLGKALEILRHHRLVELFLHETLGFGWDEVHDQAEKLEHVISEELEDRIARQLGDPVVDPHGHPIPTKDGRMPVRHEKRLIDLPAATPARISRVADHDTEMLRYLGGLGLVLNARIEIVEKSPFDGPILVRIMDGDRVQALGRRVASQVHVMLDSATEMAAMPNHDNTNSDAGDSNA